MTSNQRRTHTVLWLILGPALLVGLAMLLGNRPPVIGPSTDHTPGEVNP